MQVAREFRGLTQKQVAQQIITSPSLVSQLEAGKKMPSLQLSEALAVALGFEQAFFYAGPMDYFREEQCSFRHRRSAPETVKAQIRAHGTLIGLIVERLRTVLRFPELNVPQIRAFTIEEIEQAAERTRVHWGIDPEVPIHQTCRLLENAGVFVIPHVIETSKVDAFSRTGDVSVLFLNQATTSSSRWNFDVGHECGHLVMHGGIITGDKETEAQADRFASALLMPRRSFSREWGIAKLSWKRIFELKARWHTSGAAIVRRAYDLNLITALDYRRAYQYLSAQGWTKGEPSEPPFQEPELLKSALRALGTTVSLTLEGLCEEVGIPLRTFSAIATPFVGSFLQKQFSETALHITN